MATAKRPGGLYYKTVGTTTIAVNAEGETIEDAPAIGPDTVPVQPGTQAKSLGQEIAEGLATALRGTPAALASADSASSGSPEAKKYATLADLPDAIKKLSADEVKAMQAGDSRAGAVAIYEARLAELESK